MEAPSPSGNQMSTQRQRGYRSRSISGTAPKATDIRFSVGTSECNLRVSDARTGFSTTFTARHDVSVRYRVEDRARQAGHGPAGSPTPPEQARRPCSSVSCWGTVPRCRAGISYSDRSAGRRTMWSTTRSELWLPVPGEFTAGRCFTMPESSNEGARLAGPCVTQLAWASGRVSLM